MDGQGNRREDHPMTAVNTRPGRVRRWVVASLILVLAAGGLVFWVFAYQPHRGRWTPEQVRRAVRGACSEKWGPADIEAFLDRKKWSYERFDDYQRVRLQAWDARILPEKFGGAYFTSIPRLSAVPFADERIGLWLFVGQGGKLIRYQIDYEDEGGNEGTVTTGFVESTK
jgi:hypothetical protein